MINADKWMLELTEKLKIHFKNRLLFAGLQGSYQRQEAHEDSDIDAVLILDTVLSFDDLITYRKILATMPQNDKACGFIGGRQELFNWPKHELFQFKQDTLSYYGALDTLLPNIEYKDIIDSVKISASGLYHACCHAAIHMPQDTNAIKGMYKSAFFLLQALYYLRNGIYIRTKKELLPLLEGAEQEILTININWNAYSKTIMANTDIYFDLILRWSKEILDADF
jgi:predicted nucleotidyltransferase